MHFRAFNREGGLREIERARPAGANHAREENNMRKRLGLAVAAGLAVAFAAHGAAAEKLKIGFLPGVVDPFYQVMQLGVEKAAKDLGAEVVTQIPPTWGVGVQTPILDSMVARGDLNYIIIAPTDKDQMVGPLKAAYDAGIKIITVDTFLGDGDYAKGPVKFPISYIGSDNTEGGRIAARGLAKAIGGKGTVYINSTNPNVSSVEGREQGFKEAMAKDFPDIKVLGPDYNLDEPNKAAQQTAAVLAREPDLAGVFGTNVFSAAGRRHGGRQRRARRPCPGRRLRRDQAGDRTDGQGRRHAGPGAEAVRHGLSGGDVRRGRRRRRHQPAAPRRDRLRHHRQGQRERSGDRPLHLSGAGQVAPLAASCERPSPRPLPRSARGRPSRAA